MRAVHRHPRLRSDGCIPAAGGREGSALVIRRSPGSSNKKAAHASGPNCTRSASLTCLPIPVRRESRSSLGRPRWACKDRIETTRAAIFGKIYGIPRFPPIPSGRILRISPAPGSNFQCLYLLFQALRFFPSPCQDSGETFPRRDGKQLGGFPCRIPPLLRGKLSFRITAENFRARLPCSLMKYYPAASSSKELSFALLHFARSYVHAAIMFSFRLLPPLLSGPRIKKHIIFIT